MSNAGNNNPWKIVKQPTPEAKKQQQHKTKRPNTAPKENGLKEVAAGDSDKRFKEVHAKNIEAAKKIVENYASSSEEEEELDEKNILSSLYQHYKLANADGAGLGKTAGFLENVLHTGAAACLICIGSVRRSDAIWSCRHCYCFFHLNCIRRWANDSVAQLKAQVSQQQNDQGHYNHLGEFVPPKRIRALRWCCPQCRQDYDPSERPTEYECFCGREVNPPAQPFLVPHSCGEICGKRLQPECGHTCMLLCHPGPCPPCAQYTVTACLCGKSPKKSVRCTEKIWRCVEKCKQRLPCGEHLCNQQCHSTCPPCSSTSIQKCECGRETKKRSCSDLKWHCQRQCGSKYACGIHSCQRVCHAGACGECPAGLPRTCPCGKTKKLGPCTEVVDTCGDTCQKLLPCGVHTCTQRCHHGACNLCFVIIKKKCRCGMHEKELPCSKEFTCETKCKQIRDCGKHACNRKCCDGNCPPCDKVCGKSLSCKKHKCQSVCHEGPCYPCERQTQVNCRCGKTSRNVACGRERTARILCQELCRMPSKCHHPLKHRCHKHECPPCSQPCGQPNTTTGCDHVCMAKCHAAVKSLKKATASAGVDSAWEPHKKFEWRNLPHPKCEEKVTVTCIGGHEVAEWPCWNSKPTSCQRKCNRLLRCGNHKCDLVCHAVSDITSMAEQNGCARCQEGCNVARPEGCIHACTRPCHLPPCNPCDKVIRSKCHCGLTQVIYKCSEFFSTDGTAQEILERQERLKSCGNRCLKNFPCGHRCMTPCHPGKCPNPELCRKKVRIFCECKRIKLEVGCDKHRGGLTSLPCDENCVETRTKMEALQKQAAERLRLEEEAKNRLELEQFEKKFSKRKPRERKTTVEQTKRDFNWKLIAIYAGIAVAILLAIAAAFYEDK